MMRVLANLFLISIFGVFAFYFSVIAEQFAYYRFIETGFLPSIEWQSMNTQVIVAWLIKLIVYSMAAFILFLFIHAANLNHWLWMCIIAVIAAYGFYGVQSTVELLDKNYLINWCKFTLPAPLGVLIGGKLAIYYRLKKYDF